MPAGQGGISDGAAVGLLLGALVGFVGLDVGEEDG